MENKKSDIQKEVYQFKITLKDSKPTIWRRILVPEDYTFWDLHVAIQDAMGWFDCHLHAFETIVPRGGFPKRIGIPDDEWESDDLPGWKEKIRDWFPKERKMNYEYDFGDGWGHFVELEKIMPAQKGTKYPACIAGKMACPPEDCGGLGGYDNLLEILKNPGHPEYGDMVEWLGDDEFDLTHFDCSEVEFDDPKKRLKMMQSTR